VKVTGTKPVDAGGPVRLSPDGRRLLDGELCVTALDGGDKRCVGKVDADARLARWSPDGTKLVLTDNFFQFLREPDVWVFDTATGALRDLTDDGVGTYRLDNPDPGARIDVLPSWSPDGHTIWFARGGRDKSELMSVPARGGTPKPLGDIDCGVTHLSALAWSADRAAWTCGIDKTTVTLAGHDGRDAKRVLTGDSGEDWSGLTFSRDGKWLLADSLNQYQGYSGTSGGAARAVPAAGGDPVRVAAGKVAFPAWSPTGHALAYVDLPGTIKVVPEPGGTPTTLRTADTVAAADTSSLGWAPGKLLATLNGAPTLLTLTD
jgi:Tol biopolymer transport system component